jgi:NAD(P)-dependent dehydrogenase (short-subunit alcohol dehydrogenase family)
VGDIARPASVGADQRTPNSLGRRSAIAARPSISADAGGKAPTEGVDPEAVIYNPAVEIDLHGRTAVITGAGRGIGRATALALARCGARTILTARGETEIAKVVGEIATLGGDAVAIRADVASGEDIQRLFDQAGPVDILVNNAGIIQPVAPVLAADPDAWTHNIAINLNGVFLTCHYALPAMVELGWGRIVNVSSGAARGTTQGWSAYSAAKAGVEAFTSVLAREVEDRGVRVNAVRPGIVDTAMQVEIRSLSVQDFTAENVERFRGYKERGLLRDPADPARLILWLLGPDAEDVNGQVLAVDDPEVAARIGLAPMGR